MDGGWKKIMTDFYDRVLAIAEKKYGRDSNVYKHFEKNKQIAALNKGKTFREIYFNRPIQFSKKEK